jgi:hypothetical protein
MTVLTKKEILDQLQKLGVQSSSELDSYFQEYEEYFTLLDSDSRSSQECCQRTEDR